VISKRLLIADASDLDKNFNAEKRRSAEERREGAEKGDFLAGEIDGKKMRAKR